MKTEKIAVIGAGFAGLAVAARLKQVGLPYDQYEANDEIGGNWYNGMYDSVHTITSPRTMAFPDFPMPAHYPQFPARQQIHEYLLAYTDHYGLRENLYLRTPVQHIQAAPDEGWQLEAAGTRHRYKAVVLANGHYWDCNIPDIPGRFTGEAWHSKQYKSPEVLKGKRVLVVGAGNSGADIAAEASYHARLTHVSIRDTPWILPKSLLGKNVTELSRPWMPLWLKRLVVGTLVKIVHGSNQVYGLKEPQHKVFEKSPTINDTFFYALKHGRIQPRPEIVSLDGRQVHFCDQTSGEYDVIIWATGFKVSFPMVAAGIIPYKGIYPDLVYGTCLKDRRHLYATGLGYPRYGIGPIVHAHARLLASCLQAQDKLQQPIGRLLLRCGVRPFKNFAFEPHAFMRNCDWYSRLVTCLPYLERQGLL